MRVIWWVVVVVVVVLDEEEEVGEGLVVFGSAMGGWLGRSPW